MPKHTAHPPEEVLAAVAVCAVGIQKGHLPEGCEANVEFTDTDGDGKLEAVIAVQVTAINTLAE